MGPYNPLDKQFNYDPNTGEILEWYVKPYNNVDEISHVMMFVMIEVLISTNVIKKMVKELDTIPCGMIPKWGQTAKFLIDKN